MGRKQTLPDDVPWRDAQEFLNKHGAGAVPKVLLLMFMKAQASN
jgi:hypothetical protein